MTSTNRKYMTLLATLFLLGLPAMALGSVGTVNFAYGPVVATDAGGESRPLSKGSELNVGDTVDTQTGRAHLKFNDGGYVSLQPETQFRIDDYRFNQDNAEADRGIFSLIRGGLRALTGLIGKTDRESYQLNTPVVTIGIRGTGYTAMVDDEGANVSVGEGGIIMTNDQGTHVVNAWQAGQAQKGEAPGPSNQRPYLPPNALPIYVPEYSVSDERDADGNPLILSGATPSEPPPVAPPSPPTLEDGTGYNLAVVSTARAATTTANAYTSLDNTATFNTASELQTFTGTDASTGSALASDIGTGSVVDSGTDGQLGWGRWTSGFTSLSGLPEDNLHYIVGLAPAVMPTSGTATYTSYVYTQPTTSSSFGNNDGTFQSLTSTLAVDFGATTPAVDMTLNVDYSNTSYAHSSVTNGSAAVLTGSNFINGVIGDGTSTGTFNGFFSGTDASNAGVSYEFDTLDGNITSGVVGYQKD